MKSNICLILGLQHKFVPDPKGIKGSDFGAKWSCTAREKR